MIHYNNMDGTIVLLTGADRGILRLLGILAHIMEKHELVILCAFSWKLLLGFEIIGHRSSPVHELLLSAFCSCVVVSLKPQKAYCMHDIVSDLLREC